MWDLFVSTAKEEGFLFFGAASPKSLLPYREFLIKRRALGRESSVEEQSIDKRTNPLSEMPWAKTILTLAFPYELFFPTKFCVASYALGSDYHLMLGEKLERISSRLTEKTGFRFETYCDQTALLERTLAVESGIGFQGKNGAVISPKFGSNILLSELITDADFSFTPRLETSCGECMLCIKACPAHAITKEGVNANKCLSFITQKKGVLTMREGTLLGNRLFGCDTCQLVCPYNHPKPYTGSMPYDIEELFSISNKDFKRTYGMLASSWRGKQTLKRNALYNIFNANEIEKYSNLIKTALKDANEGVRCAAEQITKKESLRQMP